MNSEKRLYICSLGHISVGWPLAGTAPTKPCHWSGCQKTATVMSAGVRQAYKEGGTLDAFKAWVAEQEPAVQVAFSLGGYTALKVMREDE